MVFKRRAIKSGQSVTKGTNVLQGEGDYCDTIRVQQPRNNKETIVVTTPEPPEPLTSILSSTSSSAGGMDDLSLTSPSVHETIEDPVRTPKRKRDMPPPERTLSSALRRLTANPDTPKGSANNPIVLDEYSPRRKPVPLPTRVEVAQVPHKFQSRHRYANATHREPLAPKTANGTKFTGDKGKDLGRMINAKATAMTPNPPQPQTQTQVGKAAATIPIPAQTWSQFGYGIPFKIQYPMSAQYLAMRTSPNGQYQSPYAHYHNSMGLSVNGETEEMLRRKAIQYSQRPSDSCEPREKDPEPPRFGQIFPPSSTATRTKRLHVYKDRTDDLLTTLTEQSSLLTSLLQLYPKSADKKGLRDDIAKLVANQKDRVEQWIEAESPVKSASIASLINKAETWKDDEVRSLLSAAAGMWQDGSGEGVADVFAEESEGEARGRGAKKKRKLGVCGWDMEAVI
jgi:hypothetical protein